MLSMVRIPGGSSWLRALATIEAVPLIIAASALTLAELWLPAAHSSLALAPSWPPSPTPRSTSPPSMLTLQAAIGGLTGVLDTPGVRLVLAGFVLEALAFSLWSIQLLGNNYVPGQLGPRSAVGARPGRDRLGGLLVRAPARAGGRGRGAELPQRDPARRACA